MSFDINLAIFKNKGHNLKVIWSLTLVLLEKVLRVEYTCHIWVSISYCSKVMAKNKACDTKRTIVKIKVTVKVI